MLDRLLQSLNEQLPMNLQHIIQIQMENLKILSHIFSEIAIFELPSNQYRTLSTIIIYIGQNDGIK